VSQFYCREYEKKFHVGKDVISFQEQEIISKNSDEDISKIKYKQYLLTSKCPLTYRNVNNMILLNNKTLMEKIFLKDNNIYCDMRKYNKINILYNYPCDSTQLFTFEVMQNVEKQSVNVCVNQIKYKLIRM